MGKKRLYMVRKGFTRLFLNKLCRKEDWLKLIKRLGQEVTRYSNKQLATTEAVKTLSGFYSKGQVK